MAKLSGLQKDVIKLYRGCIRACYKKNESKAEFIDFARTEFHRFKDLDRKDFATIEFLLRRGSKQLEMYSNPNLKKIN